ncbi:MAG TPA: glucokinase [Rhodocyclaceae bacterium]|nr:glucokinase [Rhodocyclaceae bacterium]
MKLCGDIGGTKVLLGIVEEATDDTAPPWRLQKRFTCADYTNFAPLLGDFLAEAQAAGIHGMEISGGCLAIAGPVDADGQRAHLTNLPWLIDAVALAATFGLGRLHLVNDFVAAAAGIAALAPQDIVELQAGEPLEHDVRIVVGAGTGLGVAALACTDAPSPLNWRILPGEGGHCGFAPANQQQADLWAFLHERTPTGRVTAEQVVSGPGLLAIYDFLCSRQPADQPDPRHAENVAATLTQLAETQPDSLARQAVDLFCAAYGAFAGDMAMTYMARGGVYIAGGIAARILPLLRSGPFLNAFNTKAEHRELAMRMPLRVVTDPLLGLRGAALLATTASNHR